MDARRVEITEPGRHVLPFLTKPVVKVSSGGPFLVVEMTPIRNGNPTDAVCEIPMTQQDALRLATMIADLAFDLGWPLPEGTIVRNRMQ